MSSSQSSNSSGNPTPLSAVPTSTPPPTPSSSIGLPSLQPVQFGYGDASQHHGHAPILHQPNPFCQLLINYQLQQWNLMLNSHHQTHFHQPQTPQHQSSSHSVNPQKVSKNRVPVTYAQLVKLEERFEKDKFILKLERVELAKAIGLSEKQVKNWFQNQRQKVRKQIQKEQKEETDVEIDI